MKALLLAAGQGTRLRPLTERLPKALVPVGGVPVLGHNLRLVQRHGIRAVVITLHAHPAAIRAYVGSGSRWHLHVTYSYEDRLLGTAGAVKRDASGFRIRGGRAAVGQVSFSIL